MIDSIELFCGAGGLALVITGPIGFLFTRVFSLDLEKLKKEEHIKIEAQLQEIDTELSLLE